MELARQPTKARPVSVALTKARNGIGRADQRRNLQDASCTFAEVVRGAGARLPTTCACWCLEFGLLPYQRRCFSCETTGKPRLCCPSWYLPGMAARPKPDRRWSEGEGRWRRRRWR